MAAAAEVEEDFERMNMIDAIFGDNIKVVEQMIQEQDFDVNTRDETGRTPLIWAVVQGREKIVDFLLANGANIHARDDDGMSAIWSIIRTIHERGLRDRLNNHINIINALGTHDNTIFNLQNSFIGISISILHYAIELKVDREVIKALISAGAPVDAKDSKGNTILVPALENLKMTETLLELVDDYEIKKEMINSRNKKGDTPLLTLLRFTYIGKYYKDKVKLIIEHGADVRKPDKEGTTPIDAAEEVYTYMLDDFAAQKQEQEEESYYSDEDENDRNARIEFENKPMTEQLESMRIVINKLKASLEAYDNMTKMEIFKQKRDMDRIPIKITGDFLGIDPTTIGGNKTKKRKKSKNKKSQRKKSKGKKSKGKKSKGKKSKGKRTTKK